MMMPFFHRRWPVFYTDNHLLILYKPAGLLVQGDESGDVSLLDFAKHWVKQRHQKPGNVFLGLVHRLDRPVAGVMMFARTSKAAARLSEQLRNGSARKVYLAVVEGEPPQSSARLVHQIERRGRLSQIVRRQTGGSRQARLSYRLLDSAGGRSLLEVELETGRRHQIRLQLAHIGCPIVGDCRYGASRALSARQIALFASRLTIVHPTQRQPLTFSAPLPAGWPWSGSPSAAEPPPWNFEDFQPENVMPAEAWRPGSPGR
ncbi:MAG: RNA pseudouridine synthase [Desulfobacteraceae bacterium]|jgi:23S rRNA pseudouridine1911/1915/1917 synthase|nr:RNA pseudouridine synthase [Desulfobacteraceae bacterium]